MSTYPVPHSPYPAPPRPPSRVGRILLWIGLGCAAVFVLLIFAAVMLFRSAQPRVLRTIALTPLHMDASLSLTHSYLSVDYHLETRYELDHQGDISGALDESRDMPFQFLIHLQDSNGATVCTIAPTLDIVKDFNDHSVGVSADGVVTGCDASAARHAGDWTLDYNTPRGENAPLPDRSTLMRRQGDVKLPFPSGRVRYTNAIGTDFLTGKVFLSDPDATVAAVNDADISQIRSLSAGPDSPVILNCQADTCILISTRFNVQLPVIIVPATPVPTSHGTFHPGAFSVPRPGSAS